MKLAVGDIAPSFCTMSDEEQLVSLAQYTGKRVVLYFYPKDNTPGCTTESCDFSSRISIFQQHGAAVLGVSKDSTKSHRSFKEKYKLPFLLLSDPEAKICEKYGAWSTKMSFGRTFLGIVRSTFVIDEKGIIRGAWYGVKVSGHVEEVLKCLGSF